MSVDTSRSASSTATESPTFFSHRVTVPSETDSPRAGIVITVPAEVSEAAGAAGAAATGAATGAGVSITGAGGGVIGADATGAGAAGATSEDAPVAITASSAPTGTV